MGALAYRNATESAQTVGTSAALLLAASPNLGTHDLIVTNRGNWTIWIKCCATLEEANASNGVDFWQPISPGECARFATLGSDEGSNVFAKADSPTDGVYARRATAREFL